MLCKVKQLLSINRTDLLFALGLPATVFALVHLIISSVMLIGHPDETILIGSILLTLAAGFSALLVCMGNYQINLPQFLRFGSTRRQALALTAAMTGVEVLLTVALSYLLLALERWCSLPLCRLLSANPDLLVDDFGLWPWGILIGAAAGYVLGMGYAALLLRFGRKGGWFAMALYFGFLFGWQVLPWRTHEVTNILIPALAVGAVLLALWSLYTFLHVSLTQ